jgi:hypothetical protein
MLNKNINQAPSSTLIKDETEHLLLCFCTFCSQLKRKKAIITKYFHTSFTRRKNTNILKELLTIETNFDVVKLFIDFEPSITKSKYITKFLNSHSDIDL